MKLTRKQREEIKNLAVFGPGRYCEDCGGYHFRACPRVKRKVLASGNTVEVEYFRKWDDSWVVFPEDIHDDSEDDDE